MQRLQSFLEVEYALALLIIFHLTVNCTLESFSFQTYSLRLVALLVLVLLNEDKCPVYRDLKVFSVRPTYVSSFILSCRVTVAWYITPLIRHFLSSGHSRLALQLQSSVALASSVVLGFGSTFFRSALLWEDMIWLIFCMQL